MWSKNGDAHHDMQAGDGEENSAARIQHWHSLAEQAHALQQRAAQASEAVPLLQEALALLHTLAATGQQMGEMLQEQDERLAASCRQVHIERQRYRELFEFAPDGYLVTNTSGTIQEANRAMAALLNFEPWYLHGVPLGTFVLQEARINFAGSLARLAESKRTETWVLQLIRRDYGPFYAAATVQPVFDRAGNVFAIRWALRDVTEQVKQTHALQESETRLAHSKTYLKQQVAAQTAALRESEAALRMIAENLDDAVWLSNADHSHIFYVSPVYARLTGRSCESLYAASCSWLEAVHPDDRPAAQQLASKDQQHLPARLLFRIIRPDRTLRWVWCSVKPVCNAQGTVVRRVTVLKDVTESKVYEAEIERLAFTDPLTNLANRRRLYNLGNETLANAQVVDDALTLIYLDLDRFKAVNDTLGHEAGDTLLLLVAERLQGCVRANDMLARMGGDEFAVLLPQTDMDQALTVAERMQESLRQPFVVSQQPVYLGVSIGIAGMTRAHTCFSSLLSQADQAMYRAKAAGGGIRISDPTLKRMESSQLMLETDLRLALATNELTLYYQPVVQTDTGQVISVEALLRWNHPERGLLLADEVLTLARSTDLIWTLDCWVLQSVLQQARHWFAAGWTCDISLNISAASLRHPDIAGRIAAALTAYELPAERICIEVSGFSRYDDLSSMREVLARLKALGLSIALDGIGQDAAVLNALQQLPLDIVKVCHSFTLGLGRNLRDEVMMQSLLMLGQGLDIVIVAEGIEDAEQLAWLQTAGCPRIQGYLISKPVPPEELEHIADHAFADAVTS